MTRYCFGVTPVINILSICVFFNLIIMSLFYKIKKKLRRLKYWYLRREMVFFSNGRMYKYSYTIAIRYFKLLKILKNTSIYQAETSIADIINSSDINKVTDDPKLSFADIKNVCKNNWVEIKEQRITTIGKSNYFNTFFTADNIEIIPFIFYDKGTLWPAELDDIVLTIHKQIQFYKAEDFIDMHRKLETMFPKINVVYLKITPCP